MTKPRILSARGIKAFAVVCLLMFLFQQANLPFSRIIISAHAPATLPVASLTNPPTFHLVISSGQDSLSTLNLRCIESIFFHYPSAKLLIHSNADYGLPSGTRHPKLKPLVDLGYDIRVIQYRPGDILSQAMQAPASQIDKSLAAQFLDRMNDLQQEKYWYANEANLMRLCVLYMQGGIYLDTDVVLLNNILATNTALDDTMGRHKDGSKFHNAVMKFTQPGNPFLAAVLNDFFANFDGTKWGNNGPKAFGRTAKEHPELVCPEINIHIQNKPNHKQEPACKIHPLPNEAVAPVSYKQWEEMCFRDTSPSYEETKHILTNSLAVHFNNKATGKLMQGRKSYKKGSLCDHVLASFCITSCQE